MKRANKGRAASPIRENGESISELTTNRLSVYLRCLNQLDVAGVRTVSSQALAEQFQLNAAQIRKDLSYFDAPATVRVAANRPAKGDEIDIHFVNYNRDESQDPPKRGVEDERPIPVSTLPSQRGPADSSAARASVSVPGAPTVTE